MLRYLSSRNFALEVCMFSVCHFVRLDFHVGRGEVGFSTFNAFNVARPMHLFYPSYKLLFNSKNKFH